MQSDTTVIIESEREQNFSSSTLSTVKGVLSFTMYSWVTSIVPSVWLAMKERWGTLSLVRIAP
jgi:hypothetical protein